MKLFLVLCCLFGIKVDCYLQLRHDENIPAIDRKSVELLCLVDTDEIVKEVKWYKILENEPTRVVYYYEPPKFNLPGPYYQGKTKLAADMSSLVFNSVQPEDEGVYQCHVAVVANRNQSISAVRIPDSQSVTMKLTVYVPPSGITLTAFTSNKNLTLTCRSSQSKPSADISWLVKNGNGKTRNVKSTKVVSELSGNLEDTVGYLDWSLSSNDDNTTFECVVSHPDTATTLKKNLTIVAPHILHPVMMDFDWMSGTVPYTSYESNDAEQIEEPITIVPGLVVMDVFPSQKVSQNSTVVITVTSQGTFPEPSFSWWAEVDGAVKSQKNKLTIPHLVKSQVYYCLVENPVGRVVMSVQLDVDGIAGTEGDKGSSTGDESEEDAALASGLIVAGIAFGTLVFMFLVAFIIYYFACRKAQEKKQNQNLEGVEDGEFDSYVVKQKPYLETTVQPTGQTKDNPANIYQNSDVVVKSPEKQALLQNANNVTDSPPTPRKNKRDFDTKSTGSEATTTSGYEDDEEMQGKERAITKHLNDFDENASFVGEYGSTFGLDRAPTPSLVELEARESPFDRSMSAEESDDGESRSDQSCLSRSEKSCISRSEASFRSDNSGVEGRYTLPHDSWEKIDPNQTVQIPKRS